MNQTGLCVIAALALALPAVAQESDKQLRLTPEEIHALPSTGGGAGTSGLPGIRTTVVAGDPSANGAYTIVLQVPANTLIAAHHHRDARTAVVVAGTWYFGFGPVATEGAMKALPPGSFYTEPAGVMHFARTGPAGATVYISGIGPTDTVYDAKSSQH
ncbi:cupin domain-containing protein [Povalibacter sp.]|uniref:cupin domain-containing protein n=1 Tax=Povalibacter sp. TaxID=1962978 RepID=UPI002F3E85C6